MQRFGYSAEALDFSGVAGVRATHGRKLGDAWLYQIWAEPGARLEDVPGLTVLPSLTTPMPRIPVGVLVFLGAHGVLWGPTDTLLNLLRAWRDACGESFDSLDISIPY